jgi:hypothetical protein
MSKNLQQYYERKIKHYGNWEDRLHEWIKPDDDKHFHLFDGANDDRTIMKGKCGEEFPYRGENLDTENNYRCMEAHEKLEGKCLKCLEVMAKELENKFNTDVEIMEWLNNVKIFPQNKQFVKDFVEQYGREDFNKLINQLLEENMNHIKMTRSENLIN